MIDWTVNFGNLLQIFMIVVGGLAVFFSIKSDVKIIRNDLRYLETNVKNLNEAFQQLGKILTQVTVQDARLSMMDRSIDDLRHGRGYIKAAKINE